MGQNNTFDFFKSRVVGRDYSLTRLESGKYLHLLTGTAAYLDAPALRGVAPTFKNKDPVTARAFKVWPTGENGSLRVAAELQAALGGGTLNKSGRACPLKIEIDPELTALHLGVHAFDRQLNRFAVDSNSRDLTNPYPRQVELVDI